MEEDQNQNQNQNQNNDDEIEELEEDVKSMAQKISECRQTLPNQLTNTLNSIISSQRPPNLTRSDGNSDPVPFNNHPNLDARTPLGLEGTVEILVEENPKHVEKGQIIKQKISSNTSAMPLLVKRMRDIMSRIDKLDSFNHDMIHTAFTKNRRT